ADRRELATGEAAADVIGADGSEAGEGAAAVQRMNFAIANGEQSEPAEEMTGTEGGLGNGIRIRNLVRRPFDVARRGACGNLPVAAGGVIAAGEIDLDIVFEQNPAGDDGNADRIAGGAVRGHRR